LKPTSQFPRWCVISIIVAVLILFCCLAAYSGYRLITRDLQQLSSAFQTTPELSVSAPTLIPNTIIQQTKINSINEADETLNAIQSALIPPSDPVKTAFRLGWVKDLSRAKTDPPKIYYEGDVEEFWVMNQETNEITKKTAILRKATPHAYFWMQQGLIYNKFDLLKIAETFENDIYPKTRSVFGSEWTPGVDNDGHIFILYTDGIGESIAGIFSGDDSVPPEVNSYSNGHEMFLIASEERLSDPYTYGVLAHEFNHMILWFQDVNEDTWIAEGLADLASVVNGYDTGGFDRLFALDPDLQLNTWPEDPEAQDTHYGSSFLFIAYLFSRFGEEAVRDLMRIPENGFEGIDTMLDSSGKIDIDTGLSLSANQVFGDWAVANFLDDPSIDEGQYAYDLEYPIPTFTDTEIVGCPENWQERSVNQYGTDYINAKCIGKYNLEFQGTQNVQLLSAPGMENNHVYWSNRADASHTTLTREFDFSEVTGLIKMTYRIWYDLEDGYDYAYLSAVDNTGQWKILEPLTCTTENPVGANYGCGYTGSSGTWIEEAVDLTEFSGSKVTLQFSQITDAAVNNEGMLIDDISIPEINYSVNFEKNDKGWIPGGWVRINNEIPQTYELSIIKLGRTPQVARISAEGDKPFIIPIDFDAIESMELVVSGTTQFITTPASYQFRFVPIP